MHLTSPTRSTHTEHTRQRPHAAATPGRPRRLPCRVVPRGQLPGDPTGAAPTPAPRRPVLPRPPRHGSSAPAASHSAVRAAPAQAPSSDLPLCRLSTPTQLEEERRREGLELRMQQMEAEQQRRIEEAERQRQEQMAQMYSYIQSLSVQMGYTPPPMQFASPPPPISPNPPSAASNEATEDQDLSHWCRTLFPSPQ
ncbi:hypothetical protein C2845_PM01G33620 [Panicum miliaceum]|uniref:Uncharacterized protein n=1 Tax=Panicum miliaceum TaxID=4540 RepID=A0A3L6TRB4_PANMI|nr:hypothetical protein C2845_PM01G33620 [Panicum miliaceum]